MALHAGPPPIFAGRRAFGSLGRRRGRPGGPGSRSATLPAVALARRRARGAAESRGLQRLTPCLLKVTAYAESGELRPRPHRARVREIRRFLLRLAPAPR